ncbi:hypothetical protein OQL13_002897 [Clostridium perfringens]
MIKQIKNNLLETKELIMMFRERNNETYFKHLNYIHFIGLRSLEYIQENGITFNKNLNYIRNFGDGVYVIEKGDKVALANLIMGYLILNYAKEEEILMCEGEYYGEYYMTENREILIKKDSIRPTSIKKINFKKFIKENKKILRLTDRIKIHKEFAKVKLENTLNNKQLELEENLDKAQIEKDKAKEELKNIIRKQRER